MTTIKEQGINLDGMDIEDLWAFWQQTNYSRPIAKARELFYNQPTGYVKATKNLGNYAANKATAMKLRAGGNINTAMQYEAICESIYNRLPEFARW